MNFFFDFFRIHTQNLDESCRLRKSHKWERFWVIEKRCQNQQKMPKISAEFSLHYRVLFSSENRKIRKFLIRAFLLFSSLAHEKISINFRFSLFLPLSANISTFIFCTSSRWMKNMTERRRKKERKSSSSFLECTRKLEGQWLWSIHIIIKWKAQAKKAHGKWKVSALLVLFLTAYQNFIACRTFFFRIGWVQIPDNGSYRTLIRSLLFDEEFKVALAVANAFRFKRHFISAFLPIF